MLTIRDLKPRILEVTLSGTVTASDIDLMKRERMPALQADGLMGMAVRIDGLDAITGNVLIADARFEAGMLAQWSKLEKTAVDTDVQDFEALLNRPGQSLPMIAFRTFLQEGAAGAEVRALDLPKPAQETGPGPGETEGGPDGLPVFESNGKLTEEGTDHVIAARDRGLKMLGKINLVVRIRDREGFELGLPGDKDRMMSKVGTIGKIGRHAVAGAPGRMRAVDASEDAAAQQWARVA